MNEEILNDTKLLLGIEDDKSDAVLSFYIEDIINAILAHCRIEFLPIQLYGLVSQIAAKMLRSAEDENIRSLTEGDRRVEFADCGELLQREYYARLKPFVNRYGRVPSELDENEQRESV